MSAHAYLAAVATHRAVTGEGTFHLCPSCVNAAHAGIYRPRTSVRPMGAGAAPRACNCEDPSHAGQPSDDAPTSAVRS